MDAKVVLIRSAMAPSVPPKSLAEPTPAAVTAMLCEVESGPPRMDELVGLPPGSDTRRRASRPKASALVPMKEPSFVVGSSSVDGARVHHALGGERWQ